MEGEYIKVDFGGKLFTLRNWEEMKKQYKKEINYQHRLKSYIELLGDFLLLLKWFFLSPIFKGEAFIFAFKLLK